jgi:hypothetical protein
MILEANHIHSELICICGLYVWIMDGDYGLGTCGEAMALLAYRSY